ncbi:unnamed protein product [Lactuca saligna]|uniref:Uncharacterized protein n=1 Tax=Lactuca saligna TaxID=75948 RepID=A0AA35VZE8_LACSI|nr:unnamed protein product [Lactuca saligna]
MLRDVSKEHHELLTKQFDKTKAFLQTQIIDIRTLLELEVNKFAESSTTLHKKLVAEATTQLIEDITSFNKDYTFVLEDKTKGDAQVFAKFEEFLTEIKTMVLKQSTIFPKSISQMVSNIETKIKAELAPIRCLVL